MTNIDMYVLAIAWDTAEALEPSAVALACKHCSQLGLGALSETSAYMLMQTVRLLQTSNPCRLESSGLHNGHESCTCALLTQQRPSYTTRLGSSRNLLGTRLK
jgi:hypothetical protein